MMFIREELEKQASDARDALYVATMEAEEAAIEELCTRRDLENAKNSVILAHAEDPKALGSNEAARTARITDLTDVERKAFEGAEATTRAKRHTLALAQIDWDYAKLCVRIAEIGRKP